jgi:hypothetical protein
MVPLLGTQVPSVFSLISEMSSYPDFGFFFMEQRRYMVSMPFCCPLCVSKFKILDMRPGNSRSIYKYFGNERFGSDI